MHLFQPPPDPRDRAEQMPEMDSHPNMNAVAAGPKHETDGETDLVVSSVQMAPAVCEQSEAASRIIAKQSWLSP